MRALGRRVPQVFGLAIDAFAGGALLVDRLVERAVSIECDAHQLASLDVDILDAALAL